VWPELCLCGRELCLRHGKHLGNKNKVKHTKTKLSTARQADEMDAKDSVEMAMFANKTAMFAVEMSMFANGAFIEDNVCSRNVNVCK